MMIATMDERISITTTLQPGIQLIMTHDTTATTTPIAEMVKQNQFIFFAN